MKPEAIGNGLRWVFASRRDSLCDGNLNLVTSHSRSRGDPPLKHRSPSGRI